MGEFMCGLAGVIAWDEKLAPSRAQLETMSACIAHRGPDGAGMLISPPATERAVCAMAHRRLAILDPDPRADQPFSDGLGHHLIFNGEIYNFQALKSEIAQLKPDYRWRTTCDSEVLLLAYAAWGEKCVEKLDGMFAFAIWDEPRQTLLLARDRMGQKPLYLAAAPATSASKIGAIAFASELSAMRVLPWVDLRLDDAALEHYLRWGYVPAPLTIYRGCEKLPPARWMRVTARGLEVRQYFDPNEAENGDVASLKLATSPFLREAVIDATRRQLVSDVPLGCFLSGGSDSSVIAAAMKASVGRGQDVLTFAIGFDDARYDETAHAAEVAKHLGTRHHQFIVRPNASDDLPRLAAVFGEPFADSSALPTHYLARETRQHVKVALSGDGGDELFGGYDRYRAMLLGEGFGALPLHLREIATSKLWEKLPGTHPKSPGARIKRMLASLHLPAAARYDSYMRLFGEPLLAELWPRDAQDHAPSRWLIHQFEALAEGRDAAQTAMAVDRVTYLPEDLLTKVDRAAMLHALEVRSPFMDPALVHVAARLTSEQIFGTRGGATAFMQSPLTAPAKRLLRDAFKNDLPPQVFKRRKMGFAVPIGEWFRGELRPLLHETLGVSDSFARQHFHRPTIDRLLSEHHASQADHSQRLYALLMLELWWRWSRS
jgi:asparagine synthase (glutamine-hydrolysing)